MDVSEMFRQDVTAKIISALQTSALDTTDVLPDFRGVCTAPADMSNTPWDIGASSAQSVQRYKLLAKVLLVGVAAQLCVLLS